MTDIFDRSDEELLKEARQDENEKNSFLSELITRYINIIVIKANKITHGANFYDAEDFISEGFLGLLGAIRSFDEEKGSFSAYANACIENRMKNVFGKEKRKLALSEDFDLSLVEDKSPGVIDIIIEKENRTEILKKIKKILSDREFKVFKMYLDSYSYRQISARLGISVKSVDNALSRARAKLKNF